MAFTTSPNMNLTIPGVGTETGPDFALEVNSSLTLIDQHDHTTGKGVLITTDALNINADLTFNGFSLLNASTVNFNAGGTPSLMSLYVSPGGEGTPIEDLFYKDSAGNAVQLTKGGMVNASIANLPGQSYSAGTFIWKQGNGSTTPANFDIGSITLRPNTAATTFGVKLSPPSGISSSYTLRMPVDPGSLTNDAFLTLSSTGVINETVSTSKGITSAMIADGTITTTQISATANITGSQLSATAGIAGTQLAIPTAVSSGAGTSSTSSATYGTMTSVGFTTGGTRPVYVYVTGEIDFASGPSNSTCGFRLLRDATVIAEFSQAAVVLGTGQSRVPAGGLNSVDLSFAAGSVTYALQARIDSGATGTVAWTNIVLHIVEG